MQKAKLIPILMLTGIALAGCDNMNHTEQNVLGGGLLGAGAGALIGAAVGHGGAGPGALIGAGVGVLGGLIYDQAKYGHYHRYYYDD
ncbi:MAG: hypothetical protein JSS07_02380 [Proteobacteria bacterium]|nr:hypothetical protein [Pseudomonadota bacterium]